MSEGHGLVLSIGLLKNTSASFISEKQLQQKLSSLSLWEGLHHFYESYDRFVYFYPNLNLTSNRQSGLNALKTPICRLQSLLNAIPFFFCIFIIIYRKIKKICHSFKLTNENMNVHQWFKMFIRYPPSNMSFTERNQRQSL